MRAPFYIGDQSVSRVVWPMTALAGIWSFAERDDLQRQVSDMLSAQAEFGPGDSSLLGLGPAVLGRRLYRLLPEDDFDLRPLVSESGESLLIGDVRLDNREELIGALGFNRVLQASDSLLLLRAYERWGDDLLERIVGDFAFAVWNRSSELLTLVRDPLGQRPLHYHLGPEFVAFASMPQGLHALSKVSKTLNRERLARFVADLPKDASGTYFKNVSKVEPGQVLKISRRGIQARRYWAPSTKNIHYPKEESYAEAFREHLDRATRARLRGAESLIAAHLSAGLDSGGVASTAARLMAGSGGRVVAFTSAPRHGFSGPVPRGRIADESLPAAEVAAAYANMEHVIVRLGRRSPLDELESASKSYQEPVAFPCNYLWWSAINDEAKARGISVRLTAEAGNLAFSAGGPGALSRFIRDGQWLRWSREATAMRRQMPSWRGVFAASFGPWVPRQAWRALNRFASADRSDGGRGLLRHEYRREFLEHGLGRSAKNKLVGDERAFRLRMLQNLEVGNSKKGGLAQWQIDGRDPTADRRLVEFCLSLPPEQLLRDGVTRRMARVGLSDRMPQSVLYGPRGYQSADWYEMLKPADFDDVLDRLEGTEAAEVLDLGAVRQLASRWPGENVASLKTVGTFRMDLLRAISAGIFAASIGK